MRFSLSSTRVIFGTLKVRVLVRYTLLEIDVLEEVFTVLNGAPLHSTRGPNAIRDFYNDVTKHNEVFMEDDGEPHAVSSNYALEHIKWYALILEIDSLAAC